ncbi:hypothetical protein B0H10DRAFT_2232939 [Mycena sp. CBHHK59/15]|nr:hypothetical protein B0H10DRAFT_2232939 [Mycena sp. CBHHK59/15]
MCNVSPRFACQKCPSSLRCAAFIGSDVDPQTQQAIPRMFPSSVAALMEGIERTFTLMQQSEKLPSRVLDDAFHYMDRLLRLLSKKHSAFKAFAHDFSEAIFVRDHSDECAVRAVIEKNGGDWEYYKRAKSSTLNRRIRRYIPERTVLLGRLDKLFNAYQDIQCSTKKSNGPFFSDEAKEMVQHLLQTAREGYLSDPPGIPLYYLMGKDRDGLNVYRTVRGTNSLEGGFHMVVRRIFGSLRASPELAESAHRTPANTPMPSSGSTTILCIGIRAEHEQLVVRLIREEAGVVFFSARRRRGVGGGRAGTSASPAASSASASHPNTARSSSTSLAGRSSRSSSPSPNSSVSSIASAPPPRAAASSCRRERSRRRSGGAARRWSGSPRDGPGVNDAGSGPESGLSRKCVAWCTAACVLRGV